MTQYAPFTSGGKQADFGIFKNVISNTANTIKLPGSAPGYKNSPKSTEVSKKSIHL